MGVEFSVSVCVCVGAVELRIPPRFVGADTSVACLPVFNSFGDESELGVSTRALRSPSRDLDDSGKCYKMDGIFELLSNRLIFE